MATRTHYEVLDITPDASDDEVRAAYRRRAREHHPDRARTHVDDGQMTQINEAYRVLSDPARRVAYDRSLRTTNRSTGSARPPTTNPGSPGAPDRRVQLPRRSAPNMPWRTLGFFGAIAIVGVVALSQFVEPREPAGPDGIIRVGDCVEILPNTDAREIACTGAAEELVVAAFVPFDQTCPGRSEPHRDRQGMGVACVRPRPAPATSG